MAAISWQLATITDVRDETPRVKTFRLALPDWQAHLPGQHVDVRLTAEDGYQAQRSYSIATPPAGDTQVELTVEKVAYGEVSTFLHEVAAAGDRFELRGPIGGYFVWDGTAPDPLLLIAGGSGIVPLMAMIRHRATVAPSVPVTLLYSSRTREDVIYFDELERLSDSGDGLRVVHTLTRSAPPAWAGYDRRIDRQMLSEVTTDVGPRAKVFVCGPTALVELVANGLVALGLDPATVRTERFGPSGG
jgi:ferredoxin-NADP reductase